MIAVAAFNRGRHNPSDLPAETVDQTFDFFAGVAPHRAVLDDAFDCVTTARFELRLDQDDQVRMCRSERQQSR